MNAQIVSTISVLGNFGLGLAKLLFGFSTGSMALVADGIHSSLDVISSFITFLGIKTAKKPKDTKHPYGHWKAESLAGLFVAVLLAISGLWILYEAIMRFFKEEAVELNAGAIGVVIASIIIAEFLARLKFKYGAKEKSLALIADAEHSRADALSSVGVLIGISLIRFFTLADAIIALLVGIYILFEAFKVGKEITESLLDVSNKDLEEKIRKICLSHKIEIADIKSRQVGSLNFAEIKIKLPPKLKVEAVQEVTQTLEERLLKNIPELKNIVISIESYKMARSVILTKFGDKIGTLDGFEKIGPPKKGKRIIVPLTGNEIGKQMGEDRYLLIDIKDGKILTKKYLQNPYFEDGSKNGAPHGIRFAKAVRANKIITRQIGENARQGLENFGIEVTIINPEKTLAELIQSLKKND
ncbi:MAG: cation diffusion facilitator family transporter [Patescibacteria group bacterium]|nr:cation diffusion facilitator family transporter [Patescibacteria group bacterium]